MKLSRMNELINKLADEPFEYGKSDCYTFTAALVKEWHGKDFSKAIQYEDEDGANDFLKTYGYPALVTGTLGYPRTDVTNCEDGDVVLANLPEPMIGFVYNDYGYFKTKKTVVRLKLKKCLIGWKVK